MTRKEQLLLEIEAAQVRHAWVQAQIERGEETPALKKYLNTVREEFQTLRTRYLDMYEGKVQ